MEIAGKLRAGVAGGEARLRCSALTSTPQVTSSVQQFEWLRDDRYDLIQTAPDNVVNYRVNEHNPVGEVLDTCLAIGTDYGMNLQLVAVPGIRLMKDLRGKAVGVDAPTSGFAFVLYEMLQSQGLERGVDYTVIPSGGTPQRYEALLGRQVATTLLNGGFEVVAAEGGCPVLMSAHDLIRPYLGTGIAAKTAWWKRHEDTAVRFIRAYAAATGWCFERQNHDEAVRLLTSLPGISHPIAERLYEAQLRPGVGVVPDLDIDPRAIRSVLTLRAKWGGFESQQDLDRLAGPSGGIYDLAYRSRALSGNSTRIIG